MTDRADDFAQALRRAMAGKNFATLEEAQGFVDAFSAKRNSTPREEFCGLSPDQMVGLLYYPWEPEAIVRFRPLAEAPAQAPAMILLQTLMDAIGDKGLKPTATGNLPRALVRAAAEKYSPCHPLEFCLPPDRIQSEDDFLPVNVTRIAAGVAGIIRKYRGRFILSRDCRRVLDRNGMAAVYTWLLSAFILDYNWGYADGYPEMHIVQRSAAFSLYILHRFGGEWRPRAFYEDIFLRAFPMALREVPERQYSTPEETVRHCFSLRFLDRFACFFGFAEMRGIESQGIEVRKLPLLDEAVELDPCLPR